MSDAHTKIIIYDGVTYKSLARFGLPFQFIGENGILIDHEGKTLKASSDHHGYEARRFRVPGSDKKMVWHQVHRLVAIMFLGCPENYRNLQVNHIDGNRKNNNASNLEWCTAKENAQHSKHNGVRKQCAVLRFAYKRDDSGNLVFVCKYKNTKIAAQETGASIHALYRLGDNKFFVVRPTAQFEGCLLKREGTHVTPYKRGRENSFVLPKGFKMSTIVPAPYALNPETGIVINARNGKIIEPVQEHGSKYSFKFNVKKEKPFIISASKLFALEFLEIPKGVNIRDLITIAKDRNHQNFLPKNLILCTHQQASALINGVRIKIHDRDGRYVGTFMSKTDASNMTGIGHNVIDRILRNGYIKENDPYLFEFAKEEDEPIPVIFTDEFDEADIEIAVPCTGACSSSCSGHHDARTTIELRDDSPEIVPCTGACSSSCPGHHILSNTNEGIREVVDDEIIPIVSRPNTKIIPQKKDVTDILKLPLSFDDVEDKFKVDRCDLIWGKLGTYSSRANAIMYMKAHHNSVVTDDEIRAACRDNTFILGGYKWRYTNDKSASKKYARVYDPQNPLSWYRFEKNPLFTVSEDHRIFSLVSSSFVEKMSDGKYNIDGVVYAGREIFESALDHPETNPRNWKDAVDHPNYVINANGKIYKKQTRGYLHIKDIAGLISRKVELDDRKRCDVIRIVMNTWGYYAPNK